MVNNKNEITLLIGNGLCRSFQDNHTFAEFDLTEILKKIFNEDVNFNTKQKAILEKILPRQPSLECEDDIGKLNEIIEALRILGEIDSLYLKKSEFLISEVVDAYNNLVNKVLLQIFQSSELILNNFKHWFNNKLNRFLKQNIVNVATLNYDHLLHTAIFQDEEFKQRYTDGFPANTSHVPTFSRSCFEKLTHAESKNKKNGFFHLHGSYLIRECDDGKLKKFRRNEMNDDSFSVNSQRSAVLLTSQTNKMPVIHTDFSGLLRTYHLYFLNCLKYSSELILLGYSGNDQYLNDEISYAVQSNKEIKIIIIIWCLDPDKKEEKKEFWHSRLKSKERKFKKRIGFKFFENIKDYDF